MHHIYILFLINVNCQSPLKLKTMTHCEKTQYYDTLNH